MDLSEALTAEPKTARAICEAVFPGRAPWASSAKVYMELFRLIASGRVRVAKFSDVPLEAEFAKIPETDQ